MGGGFGIPKLYVKFWWPMFLALKTRFFWPKVIFGFINPLALRVSRKVSKVRRQILYLAHIARSRIQEVYFWSSGQKLSDVHSNSEFCWDFTFTFVHSLLGLMNIGQNQLRATEISRSKTFQQEKDLLAVNFGVRCCESNTIPISHFLRFWGFAWNAWILRHVNSD